MALRKSKTHRSNHEQEAHLDNNHANKNKSKHDDAKNNRGSKRSLSDKIDDFFDSPAWTGMKSAGAFAAIAALVAIYMKVKGYFTGEKFVDGPTDEEFKLQKATIEKIKNAAENEKKDKEKDTKELNDKVEFSNKKEFANKSVDDNLLEAEKAEFQKKYNELNQEYMKLNDENNQLKNDYAKGNIGEDKKEEIIDKIDSNTKEIKEILIKQNELIDGISEKIANSTKQDKDEVAEKFKESLLYSDKNGEEVYKLGKELEEQKEKENYEKMSMAFGPLGYLGMKAGEWIKEKFSDEKESKESYNLNKEEISKSLDEYKNNFEKDQIHKKELATKYESMGIPYKISEENGMLNIDAFEGKIYRGLTYEQAEKFSEQRVQALKEQNFTQLENIEKQMQEIGEKQLIEKGLDPVAKDGTKLLDKENMEEQIKQLEKDGYPYKVQDYGDGKFRIDKKDEKQYKGLTYEQAKELDSDMENAILIGDRQLEKETMDKWQKIGHEQLKAKEQNAEVNSGQQVQKQNIDKNKDILSGGAMPFVDFFSEHKLPQKKSELEKAHETYAVKVDKNIQDRQEAISKNEEYATFEDGKINKEQQNQTNQETNKKQEELELDNLSLDDIQNSKTENNKENKETTSQEEHQDQEQSSIKRQRL
ncbi:hypothetical protein ACSNZR_001335 [Campylobacter jejuni]